MNGAVPRDQAVSRRFLRYPIDVRIVVHVHRATGVTSFWGRTSELGEDGLGATLTGEIERGEAVTIEFALPLAAYPLKFRALVRYRTGLRHGLEFLTLTEEQHQSVERVCRLLANTQ
jgi:hypothetical protein